MNKLKIISKGLYVQPEPMPIVQSIAQSKATGKHADVSMLVSRTKRGPIIERGKQGNGLLSRERLWIIQTARFQTSCSQKDSVLTSLLSKVTITYSQSFHVYLFAEQMAKCYKRMQQQA